MMSSTRPLTLTAVRAARDSLRSALNASRSVASAATAAGTRQPRKRQRNGNSDDSAPSSPERAPPIGAASAAAAGASAAAAAAVTPFQAPAVRSAVEVLQLWVQVLRRFGAIIKLPPPTNVVHNCHQRPHASKRLFSHNLITNKTIATAVQANLNAALVILLSHTLTSISITFVQWMLSSCIEQAIVCLVVAVQTMLCSPFDFLFRFPFHRCLSARSLDTSHLLARTDHTATANQLDTNLCPLRACFSAASRTGHTG